MRAGRASEEQPENKELKALAASACALALEFEIPRAIASVEIALALRGEDKFAPIGVRIGPAPEDAQLWSGDAAPGLLPAIARLRRVDPGSPHLAAADGIADLHRFVLAALDLSEKAPDCAVAKSILELTDQLRVQLRPGARVFADGLMRMRAREMFDWAQHGIPDEELVRRIGGEPVEGVAELTHEILRVASLARESLKTAICYDASLAEHEGELESHVAVLLARAPKIAAGVALAHACQSLADLSELKQPAERRRRIAAARKDGLLSPEGVVEDAGRMINEDFANYQKSYESLSGASFHASNCDVKSVAP